MSVARKATGRGRGGRDGVVRSEGRGRADGLNLAVMGGADPRRLTGTRPLSVRVAGCCSLAWSPMIDG